VSTKSLKMLAQYAYVGQDLSVLRVKDTTSYAGSLKLEQIDVVFGKHVRYYSSSF
jgi:hypothetical protein